MFFCSQKVEKNTLKSCSEKLKSTFFSLLPWLPKRPKQKNSCAKIWPIDQLSVHGTGYKTCDTIFWKVQCVNAVQTRPKKSQTFVTLSNSATCCGFLFCLVWPRNSIQKKYHTKTNKLSYFQKEIGIPTYLPSFLLFLFYRRYV